MSLIREVLATSVVQRLTGDAVYSLIIKVAAMVLSFSATVILTRLVPASEFGVYMYALSLVSLLKIVAVLGGDRWLVREVASSTDETGPGYVTILRKRTVSISLTVAILISGFLYVAVENVPGLFNSEATGVVKVAAILLPPLALLAIYQAYIRGLHHSVAAQIPDSLIRPGSMIVAALALFYLLSNDFDASDIMVIQIGSTLLALIFIIYMAKRLETSGASQTEPKATFDYREFFRAGLPLVGIALVIKGNMFVVNILLGNLSSATDVALFSVAKRLSDLTTFMQAAIVMPLAPAISKAFKKGKEYEMMKLAVVASWGGVIFAFPVAICLFVFPEAILSLFGAEYSQAANVLQIIAVAQLIAVSLGPVTAWLTMTKNEGVAIKSAVMGFVALVIAAVLLMPQYGAMGGAVSFISGLLVTQISMFAFVVSKAGINTSIFGVRYFLCRAR